MSSRPINRWSRKFDRCQRCGSSAHRHMRKGLCRKCYDHLRRRKGLTDPMTYNIGVDYRLFDYLRIKVWF
jgi:hypothetical protein